MAIYAVCLLSGATFHPIQSFAESPDSSQSDVSTRAKRSDKRCPKMPLVYVNKEYGFRFHLPKSWKGYSVASEDSNGAQRTKEAGYESGQSETWQKITIRHPLWTDENPREDIPILVFTHTQWELVEDESLIVSAAPFPPGEIAHNARYVFALPPRYNYDFATGYEEVSEILGCGALRPF